MGDPNLPVKLPDPPPGKSGWPWTTVSPRPRDRMASGNVWPKISIVTPCYNMGRYLEEAIRSVLMQGYPNLEYIILDGGSTDDSVGILQKYSPWLSYWKSAKDKGQGEAINKGFNHAQGDLFAWLNADDSYFPLTFTSVAQAAEICYPTAAAIYGKTAVFDACDNFIEKLEGERIEFREMVVECAKVYPTPSAFFRAWAVKLVGPLNNELYYTLDWDYWLRIGLLGRIEFVDCVWAKFRLYPESKTGSKSTRGHLEVIQLYSQFWRRKDLPRNLLMERNVGLKNLHLKYARRFWGDGLTNLFRREFTAALSSHLGALFDHRWWRLLPHALLGPHLASTLAKIIHPLRARHRRWLDEAPRGNENT